MSTEVDGAAYYRVKIEGQEVDITAFVSDITIIENVSYAVPVATVVFVDGTGALSKDLALVDGTVLTITIGPSKEDAGDPVDFRIFSGRVVRDGRSDIYHYNCILDTPKYWGGAVRRAFADKSSKAALSELASDLGMEFDGDGTDDKQTWLGLGVTGSNFALDIAAAGWINSKSCMMLGVTTEKKLLYKNISEIIMKKGEVFTVALGEGGILVDEAEFRSAAGVRNSWIGYGQLNWFDDFTGETIKFDEVEVTKPGGFLPMNADVKEAVEFCRFDVQDFNAGNTHDNYQQARYQNLRIKSLYSQIGSLLIRNVATGVKILDPLWLDVKDVIQEETDPVSDKTGKYVIFAKTRVLRSASRYAERVEIMRPNVGATGQTNLEG